MRGLTSAQAERFLNQYGLNIISEPPRKNILVKLFEQFNDFLTILLILAAFFSFLIGENIDGTLIVSIVILNGFFGIYQEAKAEESLAVLKKMTVTKTRVIRDGQEIEIDSSLLVPGDLVYLEEGVKIPADGKISKSINLQVNESALTGESLPIAKTEGEEIFSGTIISSGRGYFEIDKTGDATKFGQIASNLSSINDEETPLKKKLADLTRFIGIGGIILAILVFFISLIEGSGYFPSFLLSVSLAVAVVPEGLPAVMTITLAIGMKKMAGEKAILRKLSAIEALGSITLIATDKTGTLTMNKMKVKEIFIDNKVVVDPEQDLHSEKFNLLLSNGILCSTASLVYIHDHGSWDVLGDPTEGALLYLAQKSGIDINEERKKWKLIDEKPFDSTSKMMSVTVEKQTKITFTKGAPESILSICKLDNKEVKMIQTQVNRWASKGLRVLAFSYKKGRENIFLGMVAIHDAPRVEVKEAVSKAKSAGIRVVMVTGDNEKTAEAVAVSSGLMKEGDEILTGQQIDEYDDERLLQILPKVAVFARTNPFQKHRIVKLYQKLGEIVAVTGDGVNDAIALKQADVGVAMGLVGTDVARETADMVITDDNFATIVRAIEEGRGIINNIKNAVKYLLSCNVSEATSLFIGLVIGLPTLFYPIQLLYINLITDGLPALMLSFSPRDPKLMMISPQKEMILLKKRDQSFILLVGFFGSVLVIASYFMYSKWLYVDLGKTAAFSVLTLIQSFIFIDLWLSHRPIHKHFLHLFSPLFILGFLIPPVLQMIILIHPFTSGLFKVQSVSIPIYMQLLGVSFLILVAIKAVKKIIQL